MGISQKAHERARFGGRAAMLALGRGAAMTVE